MDCLGDTRRVLDFELDELEHRLKSLDEAEDMGELLFALR